MTHREILEALTGLLAALFTALISVTIVSTALPTIIFVSSFFTVLYYFGVLQFIVRVMARAMMYLMRTSGASLGARSAKAEHA